MCAMMNAGVTVFQIDSVETGKTDETDFVGNQDFLRAVFYGDLGSARPVVVSFKGDPRTVPKKLWSGRPWQGSSDLTEDLAADANNYFSIAVFMPDESGEYRRKKERFQVLYAVMLDDVGSKVPTERMTLAPSWMIETSPGNCQAGYLLREPLANGLVSDRLMNAIIAAGLCDLGAGGPRARLARLPVAINGKHTPPFVNRLRVCSPDLRYSVEEISAGLQLEMVGPERPRRQESCLTLERPADGDPVWIPPLDQNAVLAALRNRGLYKAPLGEGKHDITCPWVQEHTGQVDGGTAYFEPDELWPIGSFKCQHGHCAHRHISDLLRMLDI